MMRVYLVWVGEYSDAHVIGAYSSLEAAQQACAAVTGAYQTPWIDDEDGYEVDGNLELVRAGFSCWRVWFDAVGNADAQCVEPPTGEPPLVTQYGDVVTVCVDAKDRDHAIKIAADARRMYLAQKPPEAS